MNFKFTLAIPQWQSQSLVTKQLYGAILLFVICVSVARLFLARTRHRSYSQSPTNNDGKQVPEIAFEVRSMDFQRSHDLSRMIEDHAGTLPCLIRSGSTQYLVLSQPHHVHEFYDQDYEGHAKRQDAHLGNLFGFLMPGATGPRFGDDWGKIRSHFEPSMSCRAISQRVPRFTREIKTWIKTLDTGLVDSRFTFQFVVFRLLTLHLYEDAYDDRMYWRMLELYHLHEKAARASISSTVTWWHDSKILSRLPIGPAPIVRRFRNEWREFNRAVIANARGGKWTCPVEVIYRGVSAHNAMTEDAFLSILSDILFTNVDISSQVLSTVFTSLAANPAVQDALRIEIQDNENVGDGYIHRSDTLLHRVLQESMRVSPAPAFSRPELTAATKTIGGYHIPANTAVVIDARRLNNDPVTWGSDCNRWDPDRFLRVDPKDLRCGFMRYGVGAASERCLGKHAADVIFKITIMAITEQLSLKPVGCEKKSGNADLNMLRL
ncbi:cytochrome P450 [Biscogniauxia sp. FL1348]|nr:cytochrome P450 [Biscogniauxia sp. FL1348]